MQDYILMRQKERKAEQDREIREAARKPLPADLRAKKQDYLSEAIITAAPA